MNNLKLFWLNNHLLKPISYFGVPSFKKKNNNLYSIWVFDFVKHHQPCYTLTLESFFATCYVSRLLIHFNSFKLHLIKITPKMGVTSTFYCHWINFTHLCLHHQHFSITEGSEGRNESNRIILAYTTNISALLRDLKAEMNQIESSQLTPPTFQHYWGIWRQKWIKSNHLSLHHQHFSITEGSEGRNESNRIILAYTTNISALLRDLKAEMNQIESS